MLITFSGLDGAGKSTLIQWLEGELAARQRPATVFHLNEHIGVYAYLRLLRNAMLRPRSQAPQAGRAAAESERAATGLRGALRRARNAIVWNKPVRRILYPLDVLIFLGYRLYYERIQGRVLILDRYFYDTLVDVADAGRARWVQLLRRLTPTPQVPVFLDITPEESFARKGEYSVEYLRRRWSAYRQVAPLVPSAVVLPNRDLAATQATLARVLEERLA